MAYRKCSTMVSDYTVIDFETTGLSPYTNEIIELAAVKVRDDRIVDEFQMLVKPAHPVNGFITNLTGISNDMLKRAPSLHSVLKDFLDFLGDDVLVGHNISFDLGFLQARCDFDCSCLDTMQLSRRMDKEMSRHRLQDLCERHGILNEEAHRALGDCRATHGVYQKLKQLSALETVD